MHTCVRARVCVAIVNRDVLDRNFNSFTITTIVVLIKYHLSYCT